MSLNFSASQYESAYKPKTLRNWEVPKWYPEKPVACKGTTVIISNDRGHLLPGIERSKKSPWGDFRGTWSLPKKINREAANVLSAPDPVRIQQWKNRSHRRKEQLKELDLKGPKKQEKPKIEEVKAAAETPEDVKQAAEEPPADTDATQKGVRKPCGCLCTCGHVTEQEGTINKQEEKAGEVQVSGETQKPSEGENPPPVTQQPVKKKCPIHDV